MKHRAGISTNIYIITITMNGLKSSVKDNQKNLPK